MEELKAEALSSTAGSMRGPSPMEFQAFQSRLHRAGYETAQDQSDKEQHGATGVLSLQLDQALEPKRVQQGATGTLSPQLDQPLNQPEVQMQNSLTRSSSMESKGTPSTSEAVAAAGTARHSADANLQSEQDQLQKSSLWEAAVSKAAMPSDTGEIQSAAEQSQSFVETEGEPEGAQSDQAPISASFRVNGNKVPVRLSKHASPVSTALHEGPSTANEDILTSPKAPANDAEPTSDADVAAMSSPLMSAGADTKPAPSALDTIVDRIIDSKLAEAPDQEYGLTWPGLSDADLAEPETAPIPAEAKLRPGHPSAAEEDTAPRDLDARCVATLGLDQSTEKLQQSGQDANIGHSTAERQQGNQHSNTVATDAAFVTVQEGPQGGEQLSSSNDPDVRRRCDKALFDGVDRPSNHVRTQLPGMRSVLSEDARLIIDSAVQPKRQKAFLSSKLRSSAVTGPDDGAWAIPVESSSSLAEVQRMRAAMLAMQLATAQQVQAF